MLILTFIVIIVNRVTSRKYNFLQMTTRISFKRRIIFKIILNVTKKNEKREEKILTIYVGKDNDGGSYDIATILSHFKSTFLR